MHMSCEDRESFGLFMSIYNADQKAMHMYWCVSYLQSRVNTVMVGKITPDGGIFPAASEWERCTGI